MFERESQPFNYRYPPFHFRFWQVSFTVFHFLNNSAVFSGRYTIIIVNSFLFDSIKEGSIAPNTRFHRRFDINVFSNCTARCYLVSSLPLLAPNPIHTFLSSLVSLVTSQLTVNGFQVLSAFNEIIPQLYAVTMMWTLNARHELRDLSRGNNVGGISHLASGTHQWLASKRDIERVSLRLIHAIFYNKNEGSPWRSRRC